MNRGTEQGSGTAAPQRSRPTRLTTLVFAAIAGLISFVPAERLPAAGSQFTMRGEDLQVDIDSRWPGLGHGGYYPVRIHAINRGEGRVFTFVFQPESGNAAPTVSKSVTISQNATVKLTLPIPIVGGDAYGSFQVYQNGRRIRTMSQSLALPDPNHSDSRPALLVVSGNAVSADAFEQAVERMNTTSTSHGHYGYYSSRTEDHEVIPPSQLPDSWISYTGLDLVTISLADLERLPQEVRRAIREWVQTGGTLLVHNVADDSRGRAGLDTVFELSRYAGTDDWTPGGQAYRNVLPKVETDQYGNPISAVGVEEAEEASEQADDEVSRRPDFAWQADDDTFAYRPVMLGRVYAFGGNPFPGEPSDWGWFLKSLGNERYRWVNRQGLSARQQHDEFLAFLVPNVRAVPVYSFLVLITIFTIVIGPLNYYWLLRRKQLHLLLLTVPTLALATSATLVAYSLVAHGFSIKTRARSITLLDQSSQQAVSYTRAAYYAGMAPGSGMSFSPDTAVFPIWPNDDTFESGRVDWSEQQKLQSGWLRSRTRTQFVIVQNRDERGRIDFDLDESAGSTAANGLEWDLEWLVVRGEDGQFFVGENVAAGTNVALRPAEEVDLERLSDRLKRNAPAFPEGVSGPITEMFNFGVNRRYMYGYGGNQVSGSFAENLAERAFAATARPHDSPDTFPRNSYLAVCKERPGLELGVNGRVSHADWNVILGRY